MWIIIVLIAGLTLTGCTGKKKLAERDARIADLEDQVSQLEGKLQNEAEENARLKNELDAALADFKDKEQVWLQQKDRHSIITVSDEVLFNSGSTVLSEDGKMIIDKIAGVAKGHPNRTVRVEGHTDNVPIGMNLQSRFPTNWELASGRACSVLHYMSKKHDMDMARLSAIGYGEHRPIADNETTDGRKKNRRVVIVIGPIQE